MKNSRALLIGRTLASALCGSFLLIKSVDPNFLRPALESRALPVHVFLALFGAAMLLQSYVLVRPLISRTR